MNAKEESLLKLQEIALRHQFLNRRKNLSEKEMIVRSHLSNHVPIIQLSAKYGISRTTIYRWITTFASGNVPVCKSADSHSFKKPSLPMPKKEKNVESTADELARLREENKRLSEALKMSEWMNHAKDVMIDEAEKAFNIPIRKKSGAKQ